MASLQHAETHDSDLVLARVSPTRANRLGSASPPPPQQRQPKKSQKHRSSRGKTDRQSRRRHRHRDDDSSSSSSNSESWSSPTSRAEQRLEEEETLDSHAMRHQQQRLDSFGNIAYENFFLGNQLLFESSQVAPEVGAGKGFKVPPMVDVPWELREETSAASHLCSTFAFLGTRHFWWLIEYAARVTFIAMLVPAAIIYADLPHTPFISTSYALASVVIAVGTTVGMSMLFFLQYVKAGCIWLPLSTICVALHLDEYLAAWFIVYVVLLFLMAMFTEKTTRRMCLLLFNIPMVAMLGGSHDLVYPSRVLADWFLGAAFALVATLLPYPKLATRASREISASLCRNTATCFTGILDCFWAPSNTERSMSMVRIRYLVRTIDQLIDKFDVYDAFTFYEVLFFESYEYRQVRKEKVRLLFQLKMNLRTMERVINMVQEKPQMLDQTERCLLLRSHVSRPMDAISRSVETLLYHISGAKTYAALRSLTPYYELVGRSVKYLQDEFDIARRVLFYESAHYANHDNRYRRHGTHRKHGDDDDVNSNGGGGGGGAANRGEGEFSPSGGRLGSSAAVHYARDRTGGASDHRHNHRHHDMIVDSTSPACLISMDSSVERMEEYVPLMTFFVFSIANFWGTLRDYEQQMDRVREKPGLRETMYFVWRGIIDPFVDNVRLVKNLFTRHAEPEVRIVIEAAKVSVAMLISVIFFYYVDDHSLLLSGPTIIAFVSGTNPVEAVQASAARLTGTLMGSVLGFFATTLCKTSVDRVASICVITFVMSFFRPEQRFGTICMYCNFVAVTAMTDRTADSNLSRIQQNTFAIFIYCFISVAFFPVSPNQVLFEKRLTVVRDVADTVKRLMGLLREASISYEETQIRAQLQQQAEEQQQQHKSARMLSQGMGADGKSFFPGPANTLTTTTDSEPIADDNNNNNAMTTTSGFYAHKDGAPLLFEPVSPVAGAMFPAPTITNASHIAPPVRTPSTLKKRAVALPAPATVEADTNAAGQDSEEELGLMNQGFRGGGPTAVAGTQGSTEVLINGSLSGQAPLAHSRIAVGETPGKNKSRAGAGAGNSNALLPHAFTMAPEDPTIDGIFKSIFGMLDTMKATTSIMPLAADEFNVVPKEYPLRASGEVHAALYRICALVYTMASCWKVMRDKGYFTADMVHIFHNLAPLAMDISSCLERFAHILSYYVHAPSAALSSELTKGVMQLRALCTELSVRKERDLLAVIRQTIIEQQVWRPKRARGRGGRRASSSSSSSESSRSSSSSSSSTTSSSSRGFASPVSSMSKAGFPTIANPAMKEMSASASSAAAAMANDRESVSRASVASDTVAPHVSNETLVFDRALLNGLGRADEAPLDAFLRGTEPGGRPPAGSPTEKPWKTRDDEEPHLVRSVSTASASMATLSHPSLVAGSAQDSKHQRTHSHHQDAKDRKKKNQRGMSQSTSAVSLPRAASSRGLGRSWSSSAVDLAGLDDPHRDAAERLREEVRRAHQLSRADTGGAGSSHHHNNSPPGSRTRSRADSEHHSNGHHHHHHHNDKNHRHHNHNHHREHSRSHSLHSPFEESLASAPYGSIDDNDLITVPAAVAPLPTQSGVLDPQQVEDDLKGPTKQRKGTLGTAAVAATHQRSSSQYTLPSSPSDKDAKKQRGKQRTRAPKRSDRRRRSTHRSSSASSSASSDSSAASSWSSRSGSGSSNRSESSISLVQFNDSFTTPITVYDAEGLHGYTLSLEMLAKELRRVLFGLEEMLQNQV